MSVNKKFLINLLNKLIEIPTINPHGDQYITFSLLAEEGLKEVGMEVSIASRRRFPIIIGYLNKGAKPEIHFNGHYDVVPISNELEHTTFSGLIEKIRSMDVVLLI